MPNNAILSDLLEGLEATGAPTYVQWDKAQEWPVGTLNRLLKAKILTPAKAAQSIECKACEHRCYKDVVLQPYVGRDLAFIVCEEPDMQAQMGRMLVPMEHLQQWKITVKQVAQVIADLLGFDRKTQLRAGQDNIRFGMLKGAKGRQWVSLKVDSLMFEVNGYETPVWELLYFERDELTIDRARVDDCLNRSSRKEGKEYTPSTDKREARKLATQAMYQDWHDEYLTLKQKYPRKTDTWYSMQIAKLDTAQGKDSETIRKNMKNRK